MFVCNYKYSAILQSLRWLGGPQPETGTTELITGPAQAIFSHFIWKSPQWNLLSLFVYLFPFHCITDLLLLLTSKSFVTTAKWKWNQCERKQKPGFLLLIFLTWMTVQRMPEIPLEIASESHTIFLPPRWAGCTWWFVCLFAGFICLSARLSKSFQKLGSWAEHGQ